MPAKDPATNRRTGGNGLKYNTNGQINLIKNCCQCACRRKLRKYIASVRRKNCVGGGKRENLTPQI